jgi:hypothetical protein
LTRNAWVFDFQGDTLQCGIIADQVIHATYIFGAIAATKDKCKKYHKKLAHRNFLCASFANREILSKGKFPVRPSINQATCDHLGLNFGGTFKDV